MRHKGTQTSVTQQKQEFAAIPLNESQTYVYSKQSCRPFCVISSPSSHVRVISGCENLTIAGKEELRQAGVLIDVCCGSPPI